MNSMDKVQTGIKLVTFCFLVLLYLTSCQKQNSLLQSNFLLNNGDTIIGIKRIKDSLNYVIYDYRFQDWAGFTEPRSNFFNFEKGRLILCENSACVVVSEPDYKKMTVELFNFNLEQSATKNAEIYKSSEVRYNVPDYKITLLSKIDTNETDTTYLFKLKNYCSSKNININFWFNKRNGISGVFYTLSIDYKDYYYSGVGNCRFSRLKESGIVFNGLNSKRIEF